VEIKNAERVVQAPNDAMAVLASGTGGAFYHNNNDLALGFRRLGMVPETMYVLGFSPSGVAADGRFHSLKVRLAAGQRYSLQARLGYAASSADAPVPGSPSPNWIVKRWPRILSRTCRSGSRGSGGRGRRASPWSRTWIWTACISKSGRAGGAETGAGGVLLDSRGGFVTGKRSELDLNLTDATFAQLTKAGFTVSMTLEAPPGTYAVRGVVEDALEGKLTAASGAVEIKAPVAPPPEALPPKVNPSNRFTCFPERSKDHGHRQLIETVLFGNRFRTQRHLVVHGVLLEERPYALRALFVHGDPQHHHAFRSELLVQFVEGPEFLNAWQRHQVARSSPPPPCH